ncbi:hypothetical protein WJX84_006892 [Apatococcus fuscideae]|uniref:Uncharacterized protein n=1 Tax=Apatococcus fuscideae TaxID=2026836 RepID=A0AAW1SLX8_9CHLO
MSAADREARTGTPSRLQAMSGDPLKHRSATGRLFKCGDNMDLAPVTKHEDRLKKRQRQIRGSSGSIGPRTIDDQAEQAAPSLEELLHLRRQMASLHWQCEQWKQLAVKLELGHTGNLIECMKLGEALGILRSEPSSGDAMIGMLMLRGQSGNPCNGQEVPSCLRPVTRQAEHPSADGFAERIPHVAQE